MTAPNHDTHTPDLVLDDLETQLDRVADLLSQLSGMSEVPSGVAPARDPFDASQVDFGNGDWLLRVLAIQDWLNLDTHVRPALAEKEPSTALGDLFDSLVTTGPEACFELDDGAPRLTQLGAELLASRLDQAVVLATRFEELRETTGVRQATAIWKEWWEEEDDHELRTDPIKASTTTWPIQQFADLATRDRLDLSPTYQRGDVWSTDHCQKLILSILRGIPLPSVILLKRPSGNGTGGYEVVDGKQRLTSILRFIGKHPRALEHLQRAERDHPDLGLVRAFETDYKSFRKLWLKHIGERLSSRKEAEYYFPFKLPTASAGTQSPMASVLGKYYCEILDEQLPGMADDSIKDIFNWATSQYKLATIEYSEATPAQIHEVFHLYNRQGKHLNAEEIRNAIYHEVPLTTLLLVASGDSDSIEELVPYGTPEDFSSLAEIGEMVSAYGVGTARYRRTKLLSWIVAVLMQPALQADGTFAVRSTAKHIDDLLEAIKAADIDGKRHWLDENENLLVLFRQLRTMLYTHSSSAAWSAQFKDDGPGVKWQELQLVASLVGTFLISCGTEDALELMEAHHAEILAFTAAHRRPEKTQNRTQWGYIGTVALGLLATVGLDEVVVSDALEAAFGYSCVPTLRAAASLHSNRV